jgi:hypothetical protein
MAAEKQQRSLRGLPSFLLPACPIRTIPLSSSEKTVRNATAGSWMKPKKTDYSTNPPTIVPDLHQGGNIIRISLKDPCG